MHYYNLYPPDIFCNSIMSKRKETKMRYLVHLKSYNGAKRRHPSAVAIVKVYGGFLAFYDAHDYAIWKAQK